MKTREGQYPKTFINILLVALATGIFLGRHWGISTELYGIAWGAFIGLFISTLLLLYHSSNYTGIMLILLVVMLGWLRTSACLYISENDIEKWAEQDITLIGDLQEEPVVRQDATGELHIKYIVGNIVIIQGANQQHCQNDIIVYGRDNSFDMKRGLLPEGDFGFEQYGRIGDKIKVSGKLMKLHDYQNPGRMDVVMANYARNIHGQLSASKYSIELTGQEKHFWGRLAGNIRHLYKTSMDAVMPKTDSAAIFAMLFGGYGGIRPELLEAFTVTGLIHILSVSGSHITLMAGVAQVLGKVLGWSGRMTALVATIIIMLYSLLAGLVIPVVRSAIMGILTLVALTLGRERDAQHILSLTAGGILLLWPLSLYDISFQLSFGATAGLLYLSPRLQGIFSQRLPRFVSGSLAVTMGAQLAVLPFIAWYFNVVSLSSLLANILVAPLVEFIIVISLLAGIIVGLLPVVGKLIYMSASLLLGLSYELSRWIARLPGSQIYVPALNYPMWIIYYAVLGLYFLPADNKEYIWNKTRQAIKLARGREQYIIGLAAIIIIIVSCVVCWIQPKELQVHFIDVGQGDAALIITPNGRAFMIDTGGTRKGSYDIGARVDVPYLLHYGVRKLDFIMLTHAHDDHAKGVGGILGKIPVGTVLIGHEGLAEYQKAFGGSQLTTGQVVCAPLQEDTEMTVDGVKIQILYAPINGNLAGGTTGNEFSNVIKISYGTHSFLFTGDLTAEHEQRLVQQGKDLHSTVLKVGHHGSNTSSSEAFLQMVNPSWCVISVGYGNSFGHPHKEIEKRLKQYTGQYIYRTDRDGAVVFRTDGKRMRMETFGDH